MQISDILSDVANLLIVVNATEGSTESILQAIMTLSYDILKYTFIHMGGKISDLTNLKKWTVTLDIKRRWVNNIIEEGSRKIA